MPIPKTTTISPYGNFLDISTEGKKLLLREMFKPVDNHVLLDMNITNSRAIVKLFQDCVIPYCWMRFMRIPTLGSGAISTNPACSPGNKDIYLPTLATSKNLIKDFHHISLEQVMAFVSWFMGEEG